MKYTPNTLLFVHQLYQESWKLKIEYYVAHLNLTLQVEIEVAMLVRYYIHKSKIEERYLVWGFNLEVIKIMEFNKIDSGEDIKKERRLMTQHWSIIVFSVQTKEKGQASKSEKDFLL